MPTPGELIAGRYRLDEPVASGGMAEVWSATDLVLARSVAVKLISPALQAEPGFAERFRAEARTLASLRHPGIVDIYDYGQATLPDGTGAYLVMELVDGVPLSERLAAEGRLSSDETMSTIAYAADALAAAHAAGVVHRDVKPGNLLLRPDGTVTVVDFGVAVAAGVSRLTRPGEVLGTALYMAPEQVARKDISPSIDIYALGVVAYQCLAGVPPFTGGNAVAVAMRHVYEDPPPLPTDVPVAARSVVLRAMARDPGQRVPNAVALAAAARAAGATTTEIIGFPSDPDETSAYRPVLRPAGTPTAAQPDSHRSRGRTAAAIATIAVTAIVVVVVVVIAALEGRSPQAGPARPSATSRSRPGTTTGRPASTGPSNVARGGGAGPSGSAGSSAAGSASPTPTTGGSVVPTTSPPPASTAPPTSAAAASPTSSPTALRTTTHPTP